MTYNNIEAQRLVALLSGRVVATESFDKQDWQRLIELAEIQWVAPMLHARLRERKIVPPPAAAQQLRALALANIERNVLLLRELGIILRGFQAADIPVIPLKGACLAEIVYGNVALRPIGDLDLLVRVADLKKALDVLTNLGYGTSETFEIETIRQSRQHLPRLSNAKGAEVDLHWTIANPSRTIDLNENALDQIWSSARSAKIASVNVLMLAPVDLLLHLCMHASVQHRFAGIGLRGFWDMALVIRRYGDELDWEQFTRRANQWNIANGVHVALELLKEWTDVEIPFSVMHSLESTAPDAMTIGTVRDKILSRSPIASARAEHERGKSRIGIFVRALRDALIPSRVVVANEYHLPPDSWRVLLYYPVRFKNLWQEHPHAVRGVLRRDKKKLGDVQQELSLRRYLSRK